MGWLGVSWISAHGEPVEPLLWPSLSSIHSVTYARPSTGSGRRVRNYSDSVHAREVARSYILIEMDGPVVARVVRDDEVEGSNPFTPTNY